MMPSTMSEFAVFGRYAAPHIIKRDDDKSKLVRMTPAQKASVDWTASVQRLL